jgi:hypothetical protein
MQHPKQVKHSLHLSLLRNEIDLHKSHPELLLCISCSSFLFLAPHKSRQVFDAPRSCYVAISPSCSYTEGMQERALPRHGTSTRNGCLIREQVDSTRARDEKTKACTRQQGPEGALFLLNTTTKRETNSSSSLEQVQASIPLERGQPL